MHRRSLELGIKSIHCSAVQGDKLLLALGSTALLGSWSHRDSWSNTCVSVGPDRYTRQNNKTDKYGKWTLKKREQQLPRSTILTLEDGLIDWNMLWTLSVLRLNTQSNAARRLKTKTELFPFSMKHVNYNCLPKRKGCRWNMKHIKYFYNMKCSRARERRDRGVEPHWRHACLLCYRCSV
jgi:hypothetical protein